MCPSTEPENATPGMSLTAADCAGLQRGQSPQLGAGVDQTGRPLSRRHANIPPPSFGSGLVARLFGIDVRTISESAT